MTLKITLISVENGKILRKIKRSLKFVIKLTLRDTGFEFDEKYSFFVMT
jgi:hypothetical protein